MSFYDTIKDMYEPNVNAKTGFSKQEHTQVEALLELLKSKAIEATQKGQHKVEHNLNSDNSYPYTIFSKGKQQLVNDSVLLTFLSMYWHVEKKQEIIQSFLKEELGKEFVFAVEFGPSRSRQSAKLKLSWPLPSNNNSVNIKE